MFAHCLSKAGLDLENEGFTKCFCCAKCPDFQMHNTRKEEEMSDFEDKPPRRCLLKKILWRVFVCGCGWVFAFCTRRGFSVLPVLLEEFLETKRAYFSMCFCVFQYMCCIVSNCKSKIPKIIEQEEKKQVKILDVYHPEDSWDANCTN